MRLHEIAAFHAVEADRLAKDVDTERFKAAGLSGEMRAAHERRASEIATAAAFHAEAAELLRVRQIAAE